MPVTARYTSMMAQVMMAIIVLAPPLEVLVKGRNLVGEEYFAALEANLIESIQRHGDAYFSAMQDAPVGTLMSPATSMVVLLALGIIGLCAFERRRMDTGYLVMGGLLVYFLTNTLLPVPFGMNAFIDRSHIYPVLVFAALFMSRDEGPEAIFGVAKIGLMIMMVASLVLMFAMPELTRRVYEPEVRLPLIDFRLWGIGESANNIGPLAMTQIVLTLHRPFSNKALTWLSYISGGLVVLLAQSQTTWIIALTVLPAVIAYQHRAALKKTLPAPAPWMVAAGAGFLVVMLFAPVIIAEGVRAGILEGTVLTGRPEVWSPAIDTFLDHPIFGYGLLAWEKDFRQNIQVLWAVHAHSQMLESLSVAGLVGGIGLVAYVGTLFYATVKQTVATVGLAPALFVIIMIRTMTEVPFSIGAIMINDMVTHLLLFRLLLNPQAVASTQRELAQWLSAQRA